MSGLWPLHTVAGLGATTYLGDGPVAVTAAMRVVYWVIWIITMRSLSLTLCRYAVPCHAMPCCLSLPPAASVRP